MKNMIAKVIMVKDQKGSPDGITIIEYKKGQEYTIPKDLRDSFIKLKAAIDVKKVEVKVIKEVTIEEKRKEIEKEIKELNEKKLDAPVNKIKVPNNKMVKTPSNKKRKR